jgi:ATP-binding protein involved in chromosome partitioning
MRQPKKLENVKQVIALASCKGGVGKYTSAANLALALAHQGMRVGLLDADIYGPSQPLILGIAENTRPELDGEYFVPISAHGLQTMSLGYLVTEQTPMIWRGPIVSGTLQKLINFTKWDNLDYLIIDMPPGTGDIQLTLAQTIQIDAALIVSIPNSLALVEVKKAIEMFRKVNIPVAGIIENMALHTCSQCGHSETIFGAATSDAISQEYQLDVLAQLPLDQQIGRQNELGKPIVAAYPDNTLSKIYIQLAQQLISSLEPFAKG